MEFKSLNKDMDRRLDISLDKEERAQYIVKIP